MPPAIRLLWGIEAVEVATADRERLRAIRGRPALLAANHPTLMEPAMLFTALRRERVSFFTLVAHDTMTRFGRLSAAVLQRLGGYSVRRGRRDRPAMETTERLLAEGERVLVFPEGQTYGLNDLLLPFQQGALFMAFRAAEERERRGEREPLLAVPMAVKYRWTRPMLPEIEASLSRLEAALGSPAERLSRYDRLRRIAERLVARLEREQGVAPAGDLDARIDALRSSAASRLAAALGVRPAAGVPMPVLVQDLANAYEDYLERPARGEGEPDAGELYRLWLRLKHFLAVRDGYVSEWPSAERFLDVLGRLELDLLGRSRIRGPRRAVVRVGDAIDLSATLPEYHARRRETLAGAAARLQAAVQALLDELARTAAPVEEPGGAPA